jgi:glycosyltransferase involved in cell wall biosynthesis
MPKPLRVHHIITGLPVGGAQTMLGQLLARGDRTRLDQRVISLGGLGALGSDLRAGGIVVDALDMRRGPAGAIDAARLTGWLRRNKPDLVQTWLYHADLIGGLATRLAGCHHLMWNIRHTDLRPGSDKRSTILVARACAAVSGWLPERIVCNSETALQTHVALGYPRDKFVVIPNGIDAARFCPDPKAYAAVRRELGVAAETPLIGLVGRFHPQKDHRGFLRAAALLAGRHEGLRFLLCGENVTPDNARLNEWIVEHGLGDRVHLLGVRQDMPRLTAALDVATSSSSHGEAFGNVIVEAMACGVPCVVTDVGDSRSIVGASGRVVAPGAPEALALAWADLLATQFEERAALGATARKRVIERYAIKGVVERYQALYEEIADLHGR